MKKQILLFACTALTTAGLTSCGNDTGDATSKSDFKFIDSVNINPSVSPAENFFYFANGNWLDNTEIPSDQTRWGSFELLRDNTNNDLHKLLEDAAANKNAKEKSKEKMVGDFYTSGMDTTNIEQLGIAPLQPLLDRINNISAPEEVIKEAALEHTMGIGQIFSFYIAPDNKNIDKILPQFYQSGLGLDTKNDYTAKDARSEEIRTAYKKYISDVFQLLNQDKATADNHAEAIFNLEKKLAAASLTPVEMRNPQKLYNKFSLGQLNSMTPGIDWNQLTGYLKFPADQDSLIVGMPDFFKELSNQLKSTPLDTWKNYLTFHALASMSPYLSSEFSDLHFDFFAKTLNGQLEQQPRWKRVMHVTNGSIGEYLAQLYVDKHFKPEAKERMLDLVNNLQETFAERIKNLDWMSEVTREKALAKLNTFVKKIGYPDKWKDYSNIEIVADNYVQNILNASAFEYDYQVNKLGKEIDRSEWLMMPSIVNAYYYPTFNEIVFPAAILQFPFFDFDADDAINYGGIGAVIGHEMTHGFDDQGAQYDAEGYLRNWWTSEDSIKFAEKTDVIRKQFDDFRILDSIPVNGSLTLGENIADLGGVTIAYYAFKKTEQGQSDEKIDGFTGDQRFFLSWAQVWRGKSTPERAQKMIKVDPHSPEEFRCNGPLSNFVPFYEAFGIKEGDKMYRPDEIRAKVW